MSDVVVTLPKRFTHPAAPGKQGLAAWLAEGDAPGSTWSGRLWSFRTHGPRPTIGPGERVYILHDGRIVGYAPLVELKWESEYGSIWGPLELVRGGGAVAVTIPLALSRVGFRGWRYRWWKREVEIPLALDLEAATI